MTNPGEQLLETAVQAWLAMKSRPDSIRRSLSSRWYPHPPPFTREHVTVAAVQSKLELVDDGPAFADSFYKLLREAVLRGAQLVVFPEYAWLPLLGLLPPVRKLADKPLEQAVADAGPGGLTIESVFRTIAPAAQRMMQATASYLAGRFGVYLMPGTCLTLDLAGHIFNSAFLYGPEGRLIGKQDKLHPVPLEAEWMSCGQDLRVWSLPFGAVSAPVCMDFTYWETTRVAGERGAEILLDMKADASMAEPFMAARGVQTRIQESFAYGIGAYAVTDLFGLNFRGPSMIAAPLGMFGEDRHILAQASSTDGQEVLVAELDLVRLREFRREQALEFNRGLYRKYLPRAYETYRARRARDGKRIVE